MATVSLGSAAGRWVIWSAVLASSMAFIDSTALNVVLPSLQKNLSATGSDIFWILNAYLLMLAALILVGGSLGDQLGRKKIFMIGIFIFILGSTACGCAPNVTLLIAFRVIQGIGGALMIPGSLSLLSSTINQQERGKAIGTWSSVTTVVTIGGPVIGGALADAGLWRYIFFINIPIGIIALLILGNKVSESRDENGNGKLDFPGVIAIASALALLTFGFLRIPTVGFNAAVFGTLGGGLLLIVVFIIIEKRSKHPMMPLSLFANKTFSGANLLTFFLYAGLGAGMLFLSLNLVQIQGYSQLQSGLTFLPFTVLMISIARRAGSLADKYGPRLLLIFGPFIAGVGLLLLSFVGKTAGPSAYWTSFLPGVLLLGFGMSLTVAPLTTTVMSSVNDQLSGTASGINNAMTRISGVFANAIFGALAVLFFSGALTTRVSSLSLTETETHAAMEQVVNLGNAKPPASLSPEKQKALKSAYQQSFITAYQGILRIAAALGFLGSLMGALFIKVGQPAAHNLTGNAAVGQLASTGASRKQ